MATPSSFIVIYNVVSLQWELLQQFCRASVGLESERISIVFIVDRKYSIQFEFLCLSGVLKTGEPHQTVSTVISRREIPCRFFFQFFRKCAYCDIKWVRAFVLRNRTSVIHVSEQSRLSFKCDSDCWSIPEDEEKQNGILSITRKLTAIVWRIYEV